MGQRKDSVVANKNPLLTLIYNLDRQVPLIIKMLVLTVMVGLIVWAISYQLHANALKEIFQKQLSERLTEQALEDRVSFNRYVKKYYSTVRLIVVQKDFSNYIERQKWSSADGSYREDTVEVKYHRQHPSWLPSRIGLQIFPKIRYAFLLDAQGSVREVYYSSGAAASLPPSLLRLTPLMLQRSLGRSFLTEIEGSPYLIAAESYLNSHGKSQAILILSSPIDDEFLIDSLGSSHTPGHVVALVTSRENPQILISSNLMEVPVGTAVEELKKNYVVTGEEFFDYGGVSDIYIRFFSFMSNQEIKSMMESVISTQYRQQNISASIFILTAVLMMLWVTRRIQNLTQHVRDFSQSVLGISESQGREKGDQIYILEGNFQRLTQEVIKAREALKKESGEKLQLEKGQMLLEQKERQLKLLESVTEAVGVGVMTKSNGLMTFNPTMENFAEMCDGHSNFEIHDMEDVERTLLDKDGKRHVFHISSPQIFDEKIILVRDITEIKEKTDALEYLALHDSLTGLPNRLLFDDRLHQAIFSSEREGKSFALLMIDINNFKEINDTLGHYVGDMVLKHAGACLQGVLRGSDTIARFGGDEFIVLMPTSDIEQAEQTVFRLQNALKEPFTVEERSLYIGLSIGIAFYPKHGEDAENLVRKADIAMYVAKDAKIGFSVYSPDHDIYTIPKLALISTLHNAIMNEEMELHYQPQINCKTGRASGVEALLRWKSPQHGLLSPEEFIPLIERRGLMKPLTEWVIKTALCQCAKWHRAGLMLSVSVNLSQWDIHDRGIVDYVSKQLEKWGVLPEYLEIDVTENTIMADPVGAIEVLRQFCSMVVTISIDDFGIGYTSIAYLRKLPVDEIKIDKSFIIDMLKDGYKEAIVRAIINLAHTLELKVLAEGVESEEIMDALKNLGCDMVQGYYICHPLPPEELTHWLSESKWKVSEK
ncbi:MAG: EAL domain-containing protein [Nitrospirae bacterium]|nr:EAL domain-containing protein [Nitrospirota bacterium]